MTEYDFNVCLQRATAWCVKHRVQWRIHYLGTAPSVGCDICFDEWLVKQGLPPYFATSPERSEAKRGEEA